MTKLRVLVVDDDPATRYLVNKKLEKAEYEVETAKDGMDAVNIISQSYFDIVLTDLMMPGEIDGIGVLDATKEKDRHMEVILVTAYASVETAVLAMKKGAADYIQKPINFDELMIKLEKIGTLLSMAKASDDLREAMDATEKNAGQVIQNLEIMVSELQKKMDVAVEVLSRDNMDENKRINMAIESLIAPSEGEL